MKGTTNIINIKLSQAEVIDMTMLACEKQFNEHGETDERRNAVS